MDRSELEQRTKQFALHTFRFVSALPRTRVVDVVGTQLLKAATSIGANYREACHAESRADFIHKMGIVAKEASETQYWLEIICEVPIGSPNDAQELRSEACELAAIFSAAVNTARRASATPK